MPLQWHNQIWQSLEEGAGKRCSECEPAMRHKLPFNTTFFTVWKIRNKRELRAYSCLKATVYVLVFCAQWIFETLDSCLKKKLCLYSITRWYCGCAKLIQLQLICFLATVIFVPMVKTPQCKQGLLFALSEWRFRCLRCSVLASVLHTTHSILGFTLTIMFSLTWLFGAVVL